MKTKQNKLMLALAGALVATIMGGCDKPDADAKPAVNPPAVSAAPLSPEEERAAVASQTTYFSENPEEAAAVAARCREEESIAIRAMESATSDAEFNAATIAYESWWNSQPAERHIRCAAADEGMIENQKRAHGALEGGQ